MLLIALLFLVLIAAPPVARLWCRYCAWWMED